MANWRLAESLKKLREQINEAFPNRSKASDGSVGDTAHSARASDHNPNDAGVVCAIDVTHDPSSGCTGDRLAAALVKSRDPRIKYLIFNRRIFKTYPANGKPARTWHNYTGANAHTHHLHISVGAGKSLYDSKDEWDLDFDIAVVNSEPSLEASQSIQHSDKSVAAHEIAKPQVFANESSSPVEPQQPAPVIAQEQSSQTVESGAAATQVLVQPNALTTPASAPIVSSPGDTPIEATTGGFKSMVTSAVGWLTGAGAGLVALLKDNRTLLIIAAVVLVIAGVLYFVRQLVLDRDRLRIASDPTRYNSR